MDEYAIFALISASVIASLIRFKLSLKLDKPDFPLGTLLVNVISCFILAICMSINANYNASAGDKFIYFNLMLFEISTGILSTYSSFAYQLATMYLKGKTKEFIRYAAYTIAFSLVAYHLGTLVV
ncbi:MAG: CrcB family protein [Opitutales bacterium]